MTQTEAGGTIGVVQARMASSRFPGKILAPVGGRPLLAHVVERLRRSSVEEWWLATSTHPSDDVTAAWGEALGLRVHRGAMDHVLSRFAQIVAARRPEWVVRVTADEPFIDGAIVDRLLAEREALPSKVVVVGDDPSAPVFPRGYAPQLARATPLLTLDGQIAPDEAFHRAHVLSWYYAHGQVAFLQPTGSAWPPRPAWRWTLDTQEDYRMVQAAFALFGDRWRDLGYAEMVACLDAHPEVVGLNLGVRQKEIDEG